MPFSWKGFNSLVPGKYGKYECNLKLIIFKLILVINLLMA